MHWGPLRLCVLIVKRSWKWLWLAARPWLPGGTTAPRASLTTHAATTAERSRWPWIRLRSFRTLWDGWRDVEYRAIVGVKDHAHCFWADSVASKAREWLEPPRHRLPALPRWAAGLLVWLAWDSTDHRKFHATLWHCVQVRIFVAALLPCACADVVDLAGVLNYVL